MTLATVSVAVACLGVLWTLRWAAAALSDNLAAISRILAVIADGPEGGYRQELEGLRADFRELADTVERWKNEATRAENRTRSLIRDARKELAASGFESPGLEAQARELHLVDADSGRAEGVPAVHQNVESAVPALPDWRQAGLMRKFGA